MTTTGACRSLLGMLQRAFDDSQRDGVDVRERLDTREFLTSCAILLPEVFEQHQQPPKPLSIQHPRPPERHIQPPQRKRDRVEDVCKILERSTFCCYQQNEIEQWASTPGALFTTTHSLDHKSKPLSRCLFELHPVGANLICSRLFVRLLFKWTLEYSDATPTDLARFAASTGIVRISEDEIKEHLRVWRNAGEVYSQLADEFGIGVLIVLPKEVSQYQ